MTGFSPIDLSKLPAPQIIRQFGFEELLAEMKAEAIELMPELEPFLQLESEPFTKLLRVFAYYRMLDRLQFNDDARGLLLALSTGAALDGLGAFWSVERLVVQAANPATTPPIPEVKEDDDTFRRRIQLSMEGRSTAGPRGSYIYWALTSSGDLKDVSVTAPSFETYAPSAEIAAQLPADVFILRATDAAGLENPRPGDVAVTALARSEGGVPSEEVLNAVKAALNADEIRPLTDRPRVRAATIIPYQIQATLYVKSGPDRGAVLAAAEKATTEFVTRQHRIGQDITLGAIYAALFVEGVDRVTLQSPANDIAVNSATAAYCAPDGISLTLGEANG